MAASNYLMGKLLGIRRFQIIPRWSHFMGNHMCRSGFVWEPPTAETIKVIKSDGVVMMYDRPINVSALMFEFPMHKVCTSDSLYIGKKISALSENDQLQMGHDYFLLPIHFFHSALTFVTITSFAAASKINNTNTPSCQLFEIQKTESGLLRIRVRDEFISRLIMSEDDNKKNREKLEFDLEDKSWYRVCTTAQLQKEYKQLVLVARSRAWKPKLEMIRETPKKVLKFIPASFRDKKRSSSITIATPVSNYSGGGSSSRDKSTTTTTTSITHKTKKKKHKKKKKNSFQKSLTSDQQQTPSVHRHI